MREGKVLVPTCYGIGAGSHLGRVVRICPSTAPRLIGTNRRESELVLFAPLAPSLIDTLDHVINTRFNRGEGETALLSATRLYCGDSAHVCTQWTEPVTHRLGSRLISGKLEPQLRMHFVHLTLGGTFLLKKLSEQVKRYI